MHHVGLRATQTQEKTRKLSHRMRAWCRGRLRPSGQRGDGANQLNSTQTAHSGFSHSAAQGRDTKATHTSISTNTGAATLTDEATAHQADSSQAGRLMPAAATEHSKPGARPSEHTTSQRDTHRGSGLDDRSRDRRHAEHEVQPVAERHPVACEKRTHARSDEIAGGCAAGSSEMGDRSDSGFMASRVR